MRSINENKKILEYMYRIKYTDEEYFFEDIVKQAIIRGLKTDSSKAEAMATEKVNRLWCQYKKQHAEDTENGVVPLFLITNEYERKVKWIDNKTLNVQRCYYKIRPDLYRFFDSLSDREYEIMACVVCEVLGADKINLTPKGNEGGIDFFARIPFSPKSHFLFGVKGPIRIVGQCKKYKSKDNVGHMREFITTLDNVYNRSYRAGEVLPEWFKLEKGNIFGWHISNLGHQSGALDMAKNYGILVSDTKQLIDILCSSKSIKRQKEPICYIRKRIKDGNYEIDYTEKFCG